MRALRSMSVSVLLGAACLAGVAGIPPAAGSALETVITGRRPASFHTPPAIYPDGTCRRERRYEPANPGDGQPGRVAGVEVALVRDCRLGEGGFFAHLQPLNRFDEALAALHRFAALTASAGAPEALPFTLTCRTVQEPGNCPDDARAVLAGLPLDKVFIVDEAPGGGWWAAVMPTGPGQPYWKVRWIEDPEERPKEVSLSWEIPAPF
jgi:hypothetical protein